MYADRNIWYIVAWSGLSCMSSRLHVLCPSFIPCASCLKQRRSHPLRRSTVSTNKVTVQAAVALTKASQALAASLLVLINLHIASPAGAKTEHTDYISVQDRTRQRAPLNSKLLDRDLPANEQTTNLSISQQVCTKQAYLYKTTA